MKFNDKNLKVLIADGDKEIQDMMTEKIKRLGGKVIVASNGQEALFKFNNESFNIIISDTQLAKVDGIQLALSARKLNPTVPVIFVSDHWGLYQKDIQSMSHVEMLDKPVNVETLETMLNKLLAPPVKKVNAEEFSLKKGETLFNEGEAGDDMFFIKAGSFDVFKKVENKDDMFITTLKAGELVGELSPIMGSVRSATVIAHEESLVLTIPKAKLQDILEGLPKWFKILLPTIISRLNETTLALAVAKKEAEKLKK